MKSFSLFLLLFIAILAVGAYSTLFTVHQTERAMVLQFGAPQKQISAPGLYWKYPFIQTVEFFDNRVLEVDSPPQEILVLGKKRLVVDAFARYKIVDPLRFFQTIRTKNIASGRLAGLVNASLRSVLAKSSQDDLVRDKRKELMIEITEVVNLKAQDFGIKILDVRIKRVGLPEKISKDVFNRMRTERQRQAAQYRAEGEEQALTIRAEADRDVIVIKANATEESERTRGEGDAEKNRIFAEAFGKDPEFFAFYRSMQAYTEGLRSTDTRLLITPDSDFFRYFKDSNGAAPKP